jgi:hypothetical protein
MGLGGEGQAQTDLFSPKGSGVHRNGKKWTSGPVWMDTEKRKILALTDI